MAKTITIAGSELWDSINRKFINCDEKKITIEHSLYAISKWEAIWHIPFFGKEEKTQEMIVSYIKCMSVDEEIDDEILKRLSQANIKEINDYIGDSMTATWFGDDKKSSKGSSKRIITSELIYYWMTALNIPFSCEHWHLNRLITLIKVCNEEQRPKDKISRREAYSRNSALNALRRAKSHSAG